MNKGNVRLASDAQFDELRICVERAFNKLKGRIDAPTAQGWIGSSDALDRVMERLVPPALSTGEDGKLIGSLRSIHKQVLDPCTGMRTIAIANDVFSRIDDAFGEFSVAAPATKEVWLDVYETTKWTDHLTIFNSFGENLDLLCLTQHQIVQFVARHWGHLRKGDDGTLFLFKHNKAYYVAQVYWLHEGKDIVCRKLSSATWCAAHRNVVVPAQF